MENDRFDIVTKKSGKCAKIVIGPEIRLQIQLFKKRIAEMAKYDDLPIKQQQTAYVVLNELDDYDANIFIAYYAVAGESTSKLAKLFGVSQTVIYTRLNKIKKLIEELVSVKNLSTSGVTERGQTPLKQQKMLKL